MKVWKKNMVAAAILVTVCTGIYVNWLYTEDQQVTNLVDTLDEEKILSNDLLVMGDDIIIDELSTRSEYFAAVRLSRQEARDSAVSLLQEAMSYETDTTSQQTSDQLEYIVETALNEAQIESLVIAKGYADCVAYISEDGISVAVAANEGGLTQADVAVIADIVLTQTVYSIDQLRVVEVQ